jgi:predicted kinase
MPPTLTITRGLPASGKSTYARVWVDEDRAHRVRVNRDDLRAMIDDGLHVEGVTEARIVAARDGLILAALDRGLDVVCDDTNLPARVVRDLARLARRAGAGFAVEDFTDVDVDTCIERDAKRTGRAQVGEAVIRGMHTRFLRGKKLPLPVLTLSEIAVLDHANRYIPVLGTPAAVMVDIDGTVALHGTRDPYDESRVGEDQPNLPVIEAVREAHAAGRRVIFLSGRHDTCRPATATWLTEHVGIAYEGLFMRPADDDRPDWQVKRELFDRHIRACYNVRRVYDDRNQVVRMWRSLGLTVFQVAEGAF